MKTHLNRGWMSGNAGVSIHNLISSSILTQSSIWLVPGNIPRRSYNTSINLRSSHQSIDMLLDRMQIEIKNKVKELHGVNVYPTLAVISDSKPPRSQYIVLDSLGIQVNHHLVSEKNPANEVKAIIGNLNEDSSVQAILLNLKSDVDLCLYDIIAHRKDVEGRNSINFGYLRTAREFAMKPWSLTFSSFPYHISPKAQAVAEVLLMDSDLTLEGSNTVFVGQQDQYGIEMTLLLSKLHSTVTFLNEKTPINRALNIVKTSDVVVYDLAQAEYLEGLRHGMKSDAFVVMTNQDLMNTPEMESLRCLKISPELVETVLARNIIKNSSLSAAVN